MDSLAGLGAEPNKLHVFRNGVDLEKFRPEEPSLARKKLGLPGQNDTAFRRPSGRTQGAPHRHRSNATHCRKTFCWSSPGSGPERQSLEALAGKLGVADKVRFTGQLENHELPWWYSAADALVLCSSREGWANVLLESMACGTPVIATNIWGTPEVVSTQVAGRLMDDRTPAALALSFATLFADYPSRADVRAHSEKFSWEATTAAQLTLFRSMSGA